MEFDTFVRHKLPVIGIIGNDACWTQIAREQVPLFKTAVACDLDVIFIFIDYSYLLNFYLLQKIPVYLLQKKID